MVVVAFLGHSKKRRLGVLGEVFRLGAREEPRESESKDIGDETPDGRTSSPSIEYGWPLLFNALMSVVGNSPQ